MDEDVVPPVPSHLLNFRVHFENLDEKEMWKETEKKKEKEIKKEKEREKEENSIPKEKWSYGNT